MVFSISPSVNIREIDATASITATSNAPAAIVGAFRWGPIGERVLVSSETGLVNRFGKPTSFNAETFFVGADYLSYADRLYVTRVAQNQVTAASGLFGAKYAGELGNAIELSYVTSADAFSKDLDSTIVSGSIAFGSTTLLVQATSDLTTQISTDDVLKVGSSAAGYQNVEVASVVNSGTDVDTGNDNFEITLKSKYRLAETNVVNLSIKRVWKYSTIIAKAPKSGHAHFVVRDVTGEASGTPNTVLEIYEDVSLTAGAKLSDGTTNYYVTVFENRSAWIGAIDTAITSTDSAVYVRLAGGVDGENEEDISFGAIAAGYDLYRDADEVDVSFILQGKAIDGAAEDSTVNANVANYIVSNIVEHRKDCVALFSPRRKDVVDVLNSQTKTENVIAYRNAIQNSSYWIMDSGYKYRYDKYNDVYRWVPLNGDIAGLCAKVDSFVSPAGYKRGGIKNAVKLAFNPNREQRDQLYGSDVNPVIAQQGQGIILFGDKTGLGQSSAFDRINVRRLFITVEKAIASVSASFLFDFNDEFTQSQFKNLVEPYLRDIQGRRGIIDFRVVADATVNTGDIIDSNIFRGNIFIKPARTINEIQLAFIATRTGIEFDEVVGQNF